MYSMKRAGLVAAHLLWLVVFLTGCYSSFLALPASGQAQAARHTLTPAPAAQPSPTRLLPTPTSTYIPMAAPTQVSAPQAGEPAGCLAAPEQAGLSDPDKMLAYADSLLKLGSPLASRRIPSVWNAYRGKNLLSGDALALSVGDVQDQFLIQRMLNALQVAGFVTWLRKSPDAGLQILAIPLLGSPDQASPWQPYIQAYWQSRQSLPGDDRVLASLKLPPCAWEVSRGFAPQVGADWWASMPAAWPDYARVASNDLADSTQAATKVAERINWLGNEGGEGPNTMCGPLVWSLMHDAGVFPPDRGGWSEGPRSFWLSKPSTNGRPWSLFPAGFGRVYAFRQPLGTFDFSQFPLYPGDFFYTYSAGDGFDHMLMVTEVDASGNVYTVTNIVQTVPAKKVTIERVLLLNLHDPSVGIARNQWANDRVHGRTGQAGFEIFRWAWMEKDASGQPVVYQVQTGDTVGLIAERWKTPAAQIAQYNGIKVDTPLVIGKYLRIPPLNMIGR